MRIYTFFIIACATVISTNAAGTGSGDTKFCANKMVSHSMKVMEAKNQLSENNYEAAMIQSNEHKLVELMEASKRHCCVSFQAGANVSRAKKALSNLERITNHYSDLLLGFKSKKSMIDNNPASSAAAKKCVNTIGTEVFSLYDCMSSSATPKLQEEVEKLKSQFSVTYADVKNIYGI